MMRQLLALILLCSGFGFASQVKLTGVLRDAQGNGINGYLTMQLPVPAQDTTTNVQVAPVPVRFRLVNGVITGRARLYDVATLQPQGLYYQAKAYDSANNLVLSGNYYVTGTSFNLGAATPTSVTTPNVIYAGMCMPGVPGTCSPLSVALLNGNCHVAVGPHPKYANIAAAFADPGCHSIHLPDGYSETLLANITARGSTALIADGRATINMGGTNQILLTGGGAAADNFTIKSNFPISDHGNGINSGFQITGYTGTAAPIVIGNGTNPGSRTLNLYISGVNISLASGGSGAVGIDVINTVQFRIEDVNCSMNGDKQGCILLDGTGLFTGIGDLHSIVCGGNTGSGQFCIRGQNLVAAVNVIGGTAELIGPNSVCVDANQTEFNGFGFNCNSATSDMITVEGASAQVTGQWRRDSGVTHVVTFGPGTSNSQIYCSDCLFSPDGGNTMTNNGAASNIVSTKSNQVSNNLWAWRCGNSSCVLFDMVTSKAPFNVASGGEIDVVPENGSGGFGFRFAGNNFIVPANGEFLQSEGTDPGCSAGQDGIHADSTAHRVQICNNGANSSSAAVFSDTLGVFAAGGTINPAQAKIGNAGTNVTLHQHKRISTGRISSTTRTEVLLSWTNTMSDTNYTVTCNVEDSTTGMSTQGLTFERIRTKSATQVGAVISNPTAGGITGTLDCTADHD